MRTTTFILSTILVGVAGALAGTLFAPSKGSNTREKIAKKSQEYKDYLVDNFNEIAGSISHPFEDVEDQAERLSKNAINKAKEIKSDVSKKLN